jgi:hypothetical protein
MWPVDVETLKLKGFDIVTIKRDEEPGVELTFKVFNLTPLFYELNVPSFRELCFMPHKLRIFLNGLEAHEFLVEKFFKNILFKEDSATITIAFDFQLHLGDKVAVGLINNK